MPLLLLLPLLPLPLLLLLLPSRGVARVRHMGPRPQPQRLCPLKFHKLVLGAATLSQNGMELPHPKNWAGYASAAISPSKPHLRKEGTNPELCSKQPSAQSSGLKIALLWPPL